MRLGWPGVRPGRVGSVYNQANEVCNAVTIKNINRGQYGIHNHGLYLDSLRAGVGRGAHYLCRGARPGRTCCAVRKLG